MFYTNLKNQADQFLSGYKQDNPATFAAAQQAVGGLLILDGFVGIENPLNRKSKRPGIFGALIGIAVGIAFVFFTGTFANLAGVNKMTAATTAEVVSVSQPKTDDDSGGTCTIRAKYTVAGKEYTQGTGYSSSSMCALTVGQTIAINYDPNNPSVWAYELGMLKGVLKIFPIFGVIAIIASTITFVIRLLSIVFGWKLLKSGRALAKALPPGTDLGTIQNEIRQNFSKSIFGVSGN
jgi:hypothetical protein